MLIPVFDKNGVKVFVTKAALKIEAIAKQFTHTPPAAHAPIDQPTLQPPAVAAGVSGKGKRAATGGEIQGDN
jgi:hypothetical protein